MCEYSISFAISVCDAGHERSADNTTCTLCAETQYKPDAGNVPCEDLPANSQAVASRDDFGMYLLKCLCLQCFYLG